MQPNPMKGLGGFSFTSHYLTSDVRMLTLAALDPEEEVLQRKLPEVGAGELGAHELELAEEK